ncbi:MAG: hypothetical protein AAGH99_05495 [Planctomycetota bacterium]
MKQTFTAAVLVALGLLATGCTYYEITDIQSDKVFYTTNWDSKNAESGVIVFKDAASESKVTLASHQIKKISSKQYKASVNQQIAEQR